MPFVQTQVHVSNPSKKSAMTAKDIDQIILNRQRKAEMHRAAKTVRVDTTLTKEFFEGLELA